MDKLAFVDGHTPPNPEVTINSKLFIIANNAFGKLHALGGADESVTEIFNEICEKFAAGLQKTCLIAPEEQIEDIVVTSEVIMVWFFDTEAVLRINVKDGSAQRS